MDPFEQLAQELSTDPKAEQELLSRMTDDQLRLYAEAKGRVNAPPGIIKPGDLFVGMGEGGLNMSNPAWHQGTKKIVEDWNKGIGTAIDIADLIASGTVLGGGAYTAYRVAKAAPELVKALPWIGRLLGGSKGHAVGEAASQLARASGKVTQATPAIEEDIMALLRGNKVPVSANPASTAADRAYFDRVRLRQPVSANPASTADYTSPPRTGGGPPPGMQRAEPPRRPVSHNPASTAAPDYTSPPHRGGGPPSGMQPAKPVHDPAALEKLIINTNLPDAQIDRLIQIMERMKAGSNPTWIERQFIGNVQSGKTAARLRKPRK